MNTDVLERWLETNGFSLLAGVAIASTVLCAAAWLGAWLMRRQSAAARFGVWQLALGGVLLAMVLLVSFDGVPLGRAKVAELETGLNGSDQRATGVTLLAEASIPVDGPREMMAGEQANTPKAMIPPTLRWRSSSSTMAILTGLWILLSAGLIARVIGSTVRAHGIVRRADRVDSAFVAQAFDAARQRIGLSGACNVQLRQTRELAIPFTLGTLRPIIVIPAEAEAWSQAALEMVLAHELVHIARRDAFAHLLNRLACSVAGFNPLVWLVARRCAYERELACDNRVLAAGYVAADYSACLLEVAAGMRGQRQLPGPALSMAYPEFRRRIEEALACGTHREPLSKRTLGLLIAVFVAIAAAAGIVRPFESKLVAGEQTSPATSAPARTPATQTAPAAQPSVNPPGDLAVGRGTVVDSSGQPISGAKVSIELIDLSRSKSDAKRIIREWELTSDQLGEFAATGGTIGELGPEVELRVKTRAAGYCWSSRGWTLTDKERATGKWSLRTTLWVAKKVTGRVVDPAGMPIAGTIDAAGCHEDPNDNWWLSGTQVAADGRFEILIPEMMLTELLVKADGHAPGRIAIERDTTDVGDVRLQRGTRVSGRLVDRNDLAVPGVVINMQSIDTGRLEGLSFPARRSVRTDAEGRFVLPPMSGECTIWAVSTARTIERGGRELNGSVVPPVIPIVLTLPADGPVTEMTVELKEAETVTISGTARFEDGVPVVGLEINAGGGEPMVRLAGTQTDA